MLLILLFSFLAGIVTILSPCILPLLPIVLSSGFEAGVKPNRQKPIGVVLGFVASFTVLTLFLSTLIRITGASVDLLRGFAVFVILLFALPFLFKPVQDFMEILVARLQSKFNFSPTGTNFVTGLLIGLSLGVLWSPCVGPILASVITLAVSEQVTLNAFLVTLTYSLGTAGPMSLIIFAGQRFVDKLKLVQSHSFIIQKIFGITMVFVAIAIYFGWDKNLQLWVVSNWFEYASFITTPERVEFLDLQLIKK